MSLFERLISAYEENEEKTFDEVLQTVLKHDSAVSRLSETDIVELKREFAN